MSLWVMCLYMEERRGCISSLHWDWGLILDSVIVAGDTKCAKVSLNSLCGLQCNSLDLDYFVVVEEWALTT